VCSDVLCDESDAAGGFAWPGTQNPVAVSPNPNQPPALRLTAAVAPWSRVVTFPLKPMSAPAASRLVILTGAGISRESGLHTFRDADGIWAKIRLEDVATPEAFARDPAMVNEFYNQRRRQLLSPGVQPNAAHAALARLASAWPGDLLLVTQNIDDLHERAGSRDVVHMHGELLRARCARCAHTWDMRDDVTPQTPCPACRSAGARRSGGVRPDVVWFGEMPYHMDRIYDALGRCDVFAAIGTSGHVYPAAQFVSEAARAGAHTVELTLEPALNADRFAERRYGPATETVPAWVDRLLAASGP
jgi:NAD-dependent deacetylase